MKRISQLLPALLFFILVTWSMFAIQKQNEVASIEDRSFKSEVSSLYRGGLYEEVLDRLKDSDRSDLELIRIEIMAQISLGQLWDAEKLAKTYLSLDDEFDLLTKLTEGYIEKRIYSDAYRLLQEYPSLENKDEEKYHQLKIELLSKTRLRDLGAVSYLGIYYGQIFFSDEEGVYMADESAYPKSQKFDKVLIDAEGFLASLDGLVLRYNRKGKYQEIVGGKMETDDAEVHPNSAGRLFIGERIETQAIESRDIIQVEVEGGTGLAYVDQPDTLLLEELFEQVSSIRQDGICYGIRNGICYQITFLALQS